MTAQGKVNASNVKVNDRIIVKAFYDNEGHEQIRESATKTGDGVHVARVTSKSFRAAQGRYESRGKYVIETTSGTFEAAPIQTMFLAPEDTAGVKRAHAEALAEDTHREAAEREIEERAAEVEAYNLAQAEKARTENEAPGGIYHGTEWASPEFDPEAGASAPDANRHASQTGGVEGLTLNSHGGKVGPNSKDEPEGDDMTGTDTQTMTRETTGSGVVKLLEKVHERIRQNHPEVPSVVIVTGAGTNALGGKWGHFRPKGWTAKVADEGVATHLDEMFMAGETLAKGARQVLQTMLHESAHALAEKRGEQDTSRQGRWHNKVFLKTAGEMGLEYKKDKANPQIGFSEVTLTDATVAEYADLLDELDREIHLMVKLPFWLGGSAGGDSDDDGEDGGENMGKKPKGPAQPNTNNIKCVCRCEEPNIIRMSRKVLDQAVVNCGDCDSLFSAA